MGSGPIVGFVGLLLNTAAVLAVFFPVTVPLLWAVTRQADSRRGRSLGWTVWSPTLFTVASWTCGLVLAGPTESDPDVIARALLGAFVVSQLLTAMVLWLRYRQRDLSAPAAAYLAMQVWIGWVAAVLALWSAEGWPGF
jgi:hypothetical protein